MIEFPEKILDELVNLKSELEKIESKLDSIIENVKSSSAKSPSVTQTTETVEMRKPSQVVEEQKAKEKIEEKPVEGRIKCPQCGSLQFSEVEDKNKVLYYQSGAPIYAKKKVCRKCGEEF